MNDATAQIQTGLFVSLGVTVLLLAVALVFAFKHKPRAHIGCICGFLACFLVTLYFAETLGQRYDLSQPSKWIHLSLAIWTTLFTLAPITTGLQHWRGKWKVQTHKRLAWVWGACLLAALGTGIWMLSAGAVKAEFRAAPAATDGAGS
jgi:hypothetical protein